MTVNPEDFLSCVTMGSKTNSLFKHAGDSNKYFTLGEGDKPESQPYGKVLDAFHPLHRQTQFLNSQPKPTSNEASHNFAPFVVCQRAQNLKYRILFNGWAIFPISHVSELGKENTLNPTASALNLGPIPRYRLGP